VSTVASSRQTKLRPDAARHYPDIPSGVWLPASRVAFVLARRVARAHRMVGTLPDRILDATHFEFIGGISAGRPQQARSRATDEIRAGGVPGRVVGRCEGCGEEVVLVQEGAADSVLLAPALRDFLRAHEPCRRQVRQGPFFSLHE
jgi:hypothetical protein